MLDLQVLFCAMLTSALRSFGRFRLKHALKRLINIHTIFTPAVLDDFTDHYMKNIERIYKNVLMTTKSREQRKALVKKYLGWVSRQPKMLLLFVLMLFRAIQLGKNPSAGNMESTV